MELKRGEDLKRRALNLVKVKFRQEENVRETKRKDTEDPNTDISMEEIRETIRQEKEAAKKVAQGKGPAEGGRMKDQG